MKSPIGSLYVIVGINSAHLTYVVPNQLILRICHGILSLYSFINETIKISCWADHLPNLTPIYTIFGQQKYSF